MNIEQDVLRVLRKADDALTNPEIVERIEALDDVPPNDATRLVANAITALFDAGQIDRILGEGRARYCPALDPPSQTSAPLAGTLHAGAAPATTPQPEETAMPDNDKISEKIIKAITNAGGNMLSRDLGLALPKVDAAERRATVKRMCEQGTLIAQGVSSGRSYRLATDSTAQPQRVAKPPKQKAAKTTSRPQAEQPAASELPANPSATNSHVDLSIDELRAAAAEILIGHGANPIPRALHRVVVVAAGEPA